MAGYFENLQRDIRAIAQSERTFRCAICIAGRATLVRHGFARARRFFARALRCANFTARRSRWHAGKFNHRSFVGCDCRLFWRTHRRGFDAHRRHPVFAADNHFCHRSDDTWRNHQAIPCRAKFARVGKRFARDAFIRRPRRGFVADDGAHRARTSFVAADARICRSQPRARRGSHTGLSRGTSSRTFSAS